METMSGFHDPRVVLLSIVIAIVASYAALDLAARVTAAARWPSRATWLIGGACAMGLGIWSMHFTAMLAFHLPVAVTYDELLVVLSFFAAVFASAIALWVASRPRMGIAQALPASIIMGLGISAMHYTGMAAMRFEGTLSYFAPLVAVSVGIAVVVSFVAIWIAFHLRDEVGSATRKLGSAVLMGGAVCSMHYTAMAAAIFTPAEGVLGATDGVGVESLGLVAIAGSTLMVLAIVIFTSMVDRRLTAQGAALASSEEARRGQELFLRDVIDAIPHLVFAKDWDGRFTLANRTIAELYGSTPGELVGKADADFESRGDELARTRRDDRAVIESGKPLTIDEEQITSAAGEVRWFQTIKVPLRSANGRVSQVLGISTDITARKLLEDQLRQSQRIEAIGRLAGGVAHDFNNLLTVITGHADLLLESDADALPDTARLDVGEIRSAAERAAGLTTQLLAFSRKQVLEPRVLDLNVLVANVDTLLRRLIGEHIELRVVTGERLQSIEADPGQLEQVLMNLAVNSRDAMPDGGSLTIETANVELDEDAAEAHQSMRPGHYVMLAITDTGAGMDAETRSHLFEPFFTTKGPGEGTGLGLATVYGIVKQSGGFIWVYSELGTGTTFKLYFPRVGATAWEPSPASTAAASPSNGETILVVEDEHDVRRITSKTLQTRGYVVLEASNGEEALRVAEAHRGTIHLLVTDVVMPLMSGRELAEQLEALRPDMKVLYVSGYTDDTIVQHGVLQTGVMFLQKPFTSAGLASKVSEILARGGAPSVRSRSDPAYRSS